jgi:hypothetical protein
VIISDYRETKKRCFNSRDYIKPKINYLLFRAIHLMDLPVLSLTILLSNKKTVSTYRTTINRNLTSGTLVALQRNLLAKATDLLCEFSIQGTLIKLIVIERHTRITLRRFFKAFSNKDWI